MAESRLFSPLLEKIPLPLRFALSGILGNAFFMVVYNSVYGILEGQVSASTVFACVQFVCIIVNHFLNVGIVFGWPKNYLTSLMSNMPVGLISLALGAYLAGLFETMELDAQVQSWLSGGDEEAVETTSLYSSIAVMTATGVFNYVALNLVNAAPKEEDAAAKEKKEL